MEWLLTIVEVYTIHKTPNAYCVNRDDFKFAKEQKKEVSGSGVSAASRGSMRKSSLYRTFGDLNISKAPF